MSEETRHGVSRRRSVRVSTGTVVELFLAQRGMCGDPQKDPAQWGCGAHLDGSSQVDHICPVSAGGDDSPENLQLLHSSCNTYKRDRIVCSDFPQRRPMRPTMYYPPVLSDVQWHLSPLACRWPDDAPWLAEFWEGDSLFRTWEVRIGVASHCWSKNQMMKIQRFLRARSKE